MKWPDPYDRLRKRLTLIHLYFTKTVVDTRYKLLYHSQKRLPKKKGEEEKRELAFVKLYNVSSVLLFFT